MTLLRLLLIKKKKIDFEKRYLSNLFRSRSAMPSIMLERIAQNHRNMVLQNEATNAFNRQQFLFAKSQVADIE